MSVTATTQEAITLALRQRQVVIRHATGDRIVALIAIVSPGNKDGQPMLRAFLEEKIRHPGQQPQRPGLSG